MRAVDDSLSTCVLSSSIDVKRRVEGGNDACAGCRFHGRNFEKENRKMDRIAKLAQRQGRASFSIGH